MIAFNPINRIAWLAATCFVPAAVGPSSTASQDVAGAKPNRAGIPPPPAEELRLNAGVFREGLKARGLHEILELHLKEFPPKSPIDELLMRRDVELARFKEPSRSVDSRRQAIAAANELLSRLIADYPADTRRLEWMYTLGYSLVFEQADGPATNILYVGGFPGDAEALQAVSARAVQVLRDLQAAIAAEYERIDSLRAHELQTLEQSGYLDHLDRIAPNAEYVLLWALFYNAIARPTAETSYNDRLNEIVAAVKQSPAILTTPQEQSRVQIAAHVLLGMVQRRLQKHDSASELFARADSIAERLGDPQERRNVTSAVLLSKIEAVRNEVDAGRWHSAASCVVSLKERIAALVDQESEPVFLLRLVAALLEQSVFDARAASIRQDDRAEEAEKLRVLAWQPLAELAIANPLWRDRLYAVLFRTIGHDVDPSELNPIEQAAFIAGQLTLAETSPESANDYYDRALKTGEQFLAQLDENSRVLAPEIMRKMAVSHLHSGNVPAAVNVLLRIGKEYPASAEALGAVELAVGLASRACRQEPGNIQFTAAYRAALECLLKQFPTSPAAEEWRFFYGELLYHDNEFDAAVRQFELVKSTHDYFLEAGLRRIQVQAAAAGALARVKAPNPTELRARADAVLTALRELIVRAEVLKGAGASPQRLSEIDRMLADARLCAAETAVLPGVDRYEQAISDLTAFEDRHSPPREFLARLWRVRLIAHAGAGHLDETRTAIAPYLAADPDRAGHTLQQIYELALAAQRPQVEHHGHNPAALIALAAAKALRQWAQSRPDLSPAQLRLMNVQLAEAHLRVAQNSEAKQALVEALPEKIGPTSDAVEIRALLAMATADMNLGQHGAALPLFNLLATGLPATAAARWEALIGDLTCRTALGEPPDGILRVIQQQKQLYPDLGGPQSAPRLEQLLRENERRAAGPK